MIKEVRLREEAAADLEEAAVWYQQRHIGLSEEFLDQVVSLLYSIQQDPLIYPVVYRETGRALTRRFPFGVFYCIEADRIIVIAIMHASRSPRNWQIRT